MTATRMLLPDGRWHFQHGPIDLIISANGEPAAIELAIASAWQEFEGILAGLVAELETLRAPLDRAAPSCDLNSATAQRMVDAVAPYDEFITPMAAVAGSVADQLMRWFEQPGIERAAINNGGDIALRLTSGAHFEIGLKQLPGVNHDPKARVVIEAAQGVGGIATSGWRGRSFSLGIADSVTVLAANAAAADAAATMIANRINLDHPGVVRRPASQLKDDTDLGALLVTCGVPTLTDIERRLALDAGARYAQHLVDSSRIMGALLVLQGEVRALGTLSDVRCVSALPRPCLLEAA